MLQLSSTSLVKLKPKEDLEKDEEISIPLNSSSFLLSNFVLLALPMLSLPSPIKGQIISPLSSGKAKKKKGGLRGTGEVTHSLTFFPPLKQFTIQSQNTSKSDQERK